MIRASLDETKLMIEEQNQNGGASIFQSFM